MGKEITRKVIIDGIGIVKGKFNPENHWFEVWEGEKYQIGCYELKHVRTLESLNDQLHRLRKGRPSTTTLWGDYINSHGQEDRIDGYLPTSGNIRWSDIEDLFKSKPTLSKIYLQGQINERFTSEPTDEDIYLEIYNDLN